MMALLLMGYVAFVGFTVAVLVRVVHFANTPVHLRWELYPVPHESPARAKYGGSYMEELDWWTKKPEVDHLHELIDMLGEMLLIKALWHHRRKQWLVSFPFHFGMYLLVVFILLLVGGGILDAVGVPVAADAGVPGLLVYYVTMLMGFAGFGLALFGAIGLLFRRWTDPDLRDFTGPIDYLNLVLFVVLFGAAGLLMVVDPGSADLRAYVRGLVTLEAPEQLSALAIFTIAAANAMVFYIPLTHMSHFVAKYFTWHSVRWNDEALEPGGKLDAAIREQLAYKPTWSAPHIGADGTRTWVDVATTNPTEEAPK